MPELPVAVPASPASPEVVSHGRNKVWGDHFLLLMFIFLLLFI